jgi:hypothetical protein
MNRSQTTTAWAHRHWPQSRNPGIESTCHGSRPSMAHCARLSDRMDDSTRIRRLFKQTEGRQGYCGGLHNAGAFPTETIGETLTPGTQCQYLCDLRWDCKLQSNGCCDRTFLNELAMMAGRGSVRQLHHPSLNFVHCAERPSDMRKIMISSGLL